MESKKKIEMLEELSAWLKKYQVHLDYVDERMKIKNGYIVNCGVDRVEFPHQVIVSPSIVDIAIEEIKKKMTLCPFCGNDLKIREGARYIDLACEQDDCMYISPYYDDIEAAKKENIEICKRLGSLRK